MKKKFQANSAFFAAAKAGDGLVEEAGGAGEAVATHGVPTNDGSISEKGMINAYKRAKNSGAFIVQNAGLKEFPEDLCKFEEYKVDGENWWDGQALMRIDLSNNQLSGISEGLSAQKSIQHLNFGHNCIQSLPDSLFTLDKLKFLDLSNNKIEVLSEAVGQALSLVEIRATGNKIKSLPESFGALQNLETLDLRSN